MSPFRTEPSGEAVTVAVFAKAPVARQVKTRLIPRLGADGAAALQQRLLRHTLATALAADVGRVALYCAPDCRHPAFAACRESFGVQLVEQCGADLGERMHRAFTGLCHGSPVLLIGTDCPALTVRHLRKAAASLLNGCPAVVQPADDGGYVLIGLRYSNPALFADVAWGGQTVMETTRARLRQLGWDWRELETLWDVDRPADLDRLTECSRLRSLLRDPRGLEISRQ
jgi:rSAM/selenodomain-associated transferase 1